ncbi:hypothetical protein EX975_22550 [Salmonella enterica subsp. enterica serovar Gaminara]|uniref:Uncharacterized protein n=2 Tax=Salmonella enterica I TaxID=59201 RepID=A0A602MVD5_SALET|nr:hypothetical protein [Salmonella enterica subsp. enterica serovar Oranienburg]EAA7138367.1 hypothetical protein [Salmonella enterica]EBQ6165489.1 hypothetical protein [Salmonella enterica subsp. enterica serovar Senftenberg]EBU8668006.1 hypothetical protein [Salmonella enterica subsp. enterica serovar Gaminara]EBV8483491.1 hypothetical protein [Salmonella enterica subsp. enterica serovar Ago]EBX0547288.1 hypothetical protein [Salmonella enterica subsp. houtenae serovar 44:z4,z23:-]EBY20346
MCFPAKFKFDLRQMVEISISGEIGEVKAQGKWATGNTAYQVLYQAANGTAQERWFDEVDLDAVEDDRYPGCPVYGQRELPPGAVVTE